MTSPDGPPSENGWHEYKRLLLFQLEEQAKDYRRVVTRLDELDRMLQRLQVRAGVWGAMAGAIPVIAALLWKLL